MQIIETPLKIAQAPNKNVIAGASRQEKRVLIVEDDVTLRPLWESVFHRHGANIRVDWATSEEEAEQLIRHRFLNHRPYDLVVADIFLEGLGTGIDLWNRYGEEALNFVFVSGLPISKFEFLMSLNFGCPLYLKKPLSAERCRQVAEMMFSSGG